MTPQSNGHRKTAADTQAIVIVGSMAFDDLQFPRPIADPKQPGTRGDTFENVVGGSATYASLSACPYASVGVVAVVGEDFPTPTLEAMKERGIDTAGICHKKGRTFRWKGRYHEDMAGRDTLDTQLNVFADFHPQLADGYLRAPMLMLGNIHPALQIDVLDQVKKPSFVMADTMNLWIGAERTNLNKLLKRIDLLVINDEEARELSGTHNIAKAAKEILKMGPASLMIKRGEYGSLYFDADGVFAAPALLLEEINDPTGAGDAFAGGLMGYLADIKNIDHSSMRRAMLHGTATASYCVEGLGTSGLMTLDRAAIEKRVDQLIDLFKVDLPRAAAPVRQGNPPQATIR